MPGPDEAQLAAAASALGEELRTAHWRVATAESSTGGLLGHAITMIPGSSDYYPGGVISYSNRAKVVELNVPEEEIAEHGAVSAEVAAAMAEGVRARFGTEVGVAVTGIAGPEGAVPGKTIGTHWIGVAVRGHPARTQMQVFPYDRDGNRAAAALRALELTCDEVRAAHDHAEPDEA